MICGDGERIIPDEGRKFPTRGFRAVKNGPHPGENRPNFDICTIFAVQGDKLVVVSGLSDYIIADAGDVLLICPKSEEQRIKLMVNDAKMNYGDKYL